MAKQFIDEKVIVELFSKGNEETKTIILKTFPFLDVEGMIDKKEAEEVKHGNAFVGGEVSVTDNCSGVLAIGPIDQVDVSIIDGYLRNICQRLNIIGNSIQVANGAVQDYALINRGIYLHEGYDWRLFRGDNGSRILVPFTRQHV